MSTVPFSAFSLFIVLCLTSTVSNAQSVAEKIDVDGNKVISASEFKRYSLDLKTVPLSILDADNNGEIEPSEFPSKSKKIIELIGNLELDLNDMLADYPNGMTFEEFDEYTGQKAAKKTVAFDGLGILIRGSQESFDIGKGAESFGRAKPASLSFTRDSENNKTSILARGFITRPFSAFGSSVYVLSPSLEFNKSKIKPTSSMAVDSLAFRFGIVRYFQVSRTGPIEDVYVSINPTYTTDTDFESDIRSLEVQLQPTANQFGIGGALSLGPIEYRWLPTLKYEYGEVIKSGADDTTQETVTFGRIGINTRVELWWKNLDKISASFGVEYLAEVSGDVRDRKKSDFTLAIVLDEAGHYSATLSYVNGDSTAKLEDEESTNFGLGIKF